ncbi:MAG: hypothetical protein K9N55_05055 [Phycisphaerae bacterium]|nr:hypothetical protein [Phycisphaerae bacterium]
MSDTQRSEYRKVAELVAQRESKKRLHYGDNVLGFGVGFRMKGTGQRTYRELVISVSVLKKWKKGKIPKDPTAIPPYFSKQYGQYRYRIPTDVVEISGLVLHQARTRLSVEYGGLWEKGTICCLVRDTRTKHLYLLSCNHVLGALLRTEHCVGTIQTRIDLRNANRISRIARVTRIGDLASTFADLPLPSLDAAIARVRSVSEVSSRINGKIAKGIASQAMIGMKVSIPAASGALTGEIVRVQKNEDMPYTCRHRTCQPFRLRFPTVIYYKPKSGQEPQAGDSGSSLLCDEKLVGMHFGLTGSGFGVAMFARDIFRQSIFSREIELVSDHNL